jgi:hypothetical protein
MKLTRSLIVSVVVAGACCAPALAALGGDAASVEVDRASLRGTEEVRAASGYSVHDIATATGTVHEYLTPAGKVFAVSWKGTKTPDLKQMLGSSYEALQQAQATRPASREHRRLAVETPTLVVQSSVYLRTAMGRAWLPAELPANFSISAIN